MRVSADAPAGRRVAAAPFANLDFMRACAVLAVVAFHLAMLFGIKVPGPFSVLTLGHWGVLVFFVHTSFVLTLSLERQAARSPGAPLFWPFIVQRVFRIFPLSIVVVLVVVGAALPVGLIRDGHFSAAPLSAAGVWANLFLVQNLSHSDSAVVPLWSLPYEMQMYLVLPALFLLARSARGALPLLAVWAIGLVPLLRPWYFTRHGIPDVIAYVPYFLPGILAHKRLSERAAKAPAALWPLALAAITALYLLRPSDGLGAVCCLLLGLAIPCFKEIRQRVVRRVALEIARYSYGIYLTHCICMWWSFQVLRELPTWLQWACFALSVCALPVALYHAVEAPMIRVGRRLADAIGRRHASASAPA